MKKVAIIGVGITPFKARYFDKTYFELAYDATKLALEDANKNGAEITHNNLESTISKRFILLGFLLASTGVINHTEKQLCIFM